MVKYLFLTVLAIGRRLQTLRLVAFKQGYLAYGKGLHVGKASLLWAPDSLLIGDNVYIGKQVHIECNSSIGSGCLLANRVSFVGRHDHDFRSIGVPVRFSPWIGSKAMMNSPYRKEKVVVESDVWIGYGATLLTGVNVGKGAIVSAGSLVTTDVPAYSIVGGVPARVISQRFSKEEIIEHERKMAAGKFVFSERGADYWIVKPGD